MTSAACCSHRTISPPILFLCCGHASITDQMCMPSASAFVWLIYKLRLRGALTGFPKSALNLTPRWHPDVHIWAGLNEQQYCLPAVNILIDTGLFLLSKAAVTLASNHTLMHLPDHQIILWFCEVCPGMYPECLTCVTLSLFFVTEKIIYKILFITFLWILWMLFDVLMLQCIFVITM